jgi:serine/threonine protein phosphatase PrpC/predicted Ser/Thr protein kinase
MMKNILTVNIGQHTSAGRKDINQDFHGVFVPHDHLLSSKGITLAIADGISSSDVSQIASQTAVSSFLADYYCTSETWSVKNATQRVLQATNSWLYAQSRNSPHRFDRDKGYICTFSALVLKSTTAHLFHIGDTRIYRFAHGKLEQLTTDHRHFVSEDDSYITRALGINQQLDVDYHAFPLEENDTFILSSDGIHEYLSENDIIEAIQTQQDNLDTTAENLLNQAYEAGSGDNLTIQIVNIKQLPDQYLEELYQQVTTLPLPPKLSPRMEFEGYNIIRELYISSRSHVYLAQDINSEKQVVIKTPSIEMSSNESYLERFLVEEWIAKRLDNEHILKAFIPNRKRHSLYMVTEYIEGQNLHQWMIDNPKPSVEAVRKIIEQAAKGLQALHRQEMVHQDLRPNNIMIDSNGTVKIIDFGATKVAGIVEMGHDQEGIQGTLLYTAPEYFLGETGGANSDLFSLGTIAYQMLTGSLPYGINVSKSTNKASQRKLSYQHIPNDKNIPVWIDLAIKQAVHINPLKRYVEVSEFAYDLRHPNKKFAHKTKPPIIERNPVAFWQMISVILVIIIIIQALN